MPVTIKSAAHPAVEMRWKRKSSSADLLLASGGIEKSKLERIMQTSVTDEIVETEHIIASHNGLVYAAYHAYSLHHHLIIRPEDVWLAILSQFSFYVNKHAEELRGSFVPHEGKKGLVIKSPGLQDFAVFTQSMSKLIEENIVDPKLRAWVLPRFTTTTPHDDVVASITMMGTLKRYFDYVYDGSTCGIPTVTLLGEREDYVEILRRIHKLTEYGEEPACFAGMLRPVLRSFVDCFDAPADDPAIVDFWSRVAHYQGGSGMNYLTGWIVAFCFWNEDGELLANPRYFGAAKSRLEGNLVDPHRHFDNVIYHRVDLQMVPAGYTSCPVVLFTPLEDGGKKIHATLLAGSVGFRATQASEFFDRHAVTGDTSPTSASIPPSKLSSILSLCRRTLCGGPSKQTKLEAPNRSHNVESNLQDLQDGEAPAKPKFKADGAGKRDAIQPVTGWWLFYSPGSTSNEPPASYLKKMMEDWKGGVSVMRVDKQGGVQSVKHDLSDYVI